MASRVCPAAERSLPTAPAAYTPSLYHCFLRLSSPWALLAPLRRTSIRIYWDWTATGMPLPERDGCRGAREERGAMGAAQAERSQAGVPQLRDQLA